MEVKAEVPLDAFYKCWHVYPRLDKRYYVSDLISDILSGGGSSRLFQSLVKDKRLFSNIECYHTGSIDAGLMVIEGKLVKGITMQQAEEGVQEEINKLQSDPVPDSELQKVKNKVESVMAFEDMSVMNRANSLAFYELLGDADMFNHELEKYQSVTPENIKKESQNIFRQENSNTIYYYSRN